MFNNGVITILKEVNKITNSAILRYPVSILNSPSADMLVHINLQNLDPQDFPEIGVYNLSEFLNIFNLIDEEREVNINNGIIFIKDNAVSAEYISDKITLLSEYDKQVSIFDTTDSVPTVAEFKLMADEIKKIKQASKVFSDLEEVQFLSQDDEMHISLSASNRFNAKSNKFNLTKEADTSKEFDIRIPVDNFDKLPLSEYTVYIKYNATRNAYRILLKSTEISDFKILMTVKR